MHAGRNRPFIFSYTPAANDYYHLRIEFKKHNVDNTEIIQVLEEIINKLKSNKR